MNNQTKQIKVGLADDHTLIREGFVSLIKNFGDCEVIFSVSNGLEVLKKIKQNRVPDLLILDLKMPQMDGHEVTCWLRTNYPKMRILMVTQYDSEVVLIRMLKAGVHGFLKKDVRSEDLHSAIRALMTTGFYNAYAVTSKIVSKSFNHEEWPELDQKTFTDQEISFIKMSCSDLTYKEIFIKLGLPPRNADKLRIDLFNKLNVESRVGIAMFAMKHGMVMYE